MWGGASVQGGRVDAGEWPHKSSSAVALRIKKIVLLGHAVHFMNIILLLVLCNFTSGCINCATMQSVVRKHL